MGRDAMQVVLYEDNAKRRVGAMIAGLRGLRTLNTAVKGFAPLLPSMASSLLQRLLTPGQGFPSLDGPLGDLEGATDWQEAAASGRAIPAQVSCNVTLSRSLTHLHGTLMKLAFSVKMEDLLPKAGKQQHRRFVTQS